MLAGGLALGLSPKATAAEGGLGRDLADEGGPRGYPQGRTVGRACRSLRWGHEQSRAANVGPKPYEEPPLCARFDDSLSQRVFQRA